jgi:hypothetical protein
MYAVPILAGCDDDHSQAFREPVELLQVNAGVGIFKIGRDDVL